MSVLYVALPVALLLGGSALVACLLCIKSGQYDDCDSPPLKILNDDMRKK
jgi:cbb3-type cytochrome oxidase maturation protein